MATIASSTETAAPSASHDSAGCRRRGAWSSSTAIANTISATPSGQRTQFQTSPAPSDQPYVARIASANEPPATSSRNPRPTGAASTAVSTRARPYFASAFRSRPMP